MILKKMKISKLVYVVFVQIVFSVSAIIDFDNFSVRHFRCISYGDIIIFRSLLHCAKTCAQEQDCNAFSYNKTDSSRLQHACVREDVKQSSSLSMSNVSVAWYVKLGSEYDNIILALQQCESDGSSTSMTTDEEFTTVTQPYSITTWPPTDNQFSTYETTTLQVTTETTTETNTLQVTTESLLTTVTTDEQLTTVTTDSRLTTESTDQQSSTKSPAITTETTDIGQTTQTTDQEISTVTTSMQQTTIATTTIGTTTLALPQTSVCSIDAAIQLANNKIWLFSGQWIFEYQSVSEIATGRSAVMSIDSIFQDITGPVDAAYVDGSINIIKGATVYLYDGNYGLTAQVSTDTHFGTTVPASINCVLKSTDDFHLFSGTKVYDMINAPSSGATYTNNNSGNPYRATNNNKNPGEISACTELLSGLVLVFAGNNHQTFTPGSSKGTWGSQTSTMC